MLRNFVHDRRGNFAMMTALMMAPIMGVTALAIDYSQVSRQRQMTLNALDAAGIATARYLTQGATDAEAEAYAKDFFRANLGGVKPENATLLITLPNQNTGGGTLKLEAQLKYAPIFYPVFQKLRGENPGGDTKIDFKAQSEVRLKNTLEVALVLDNSGSMGYTGTGSSEKRLAILKSAAKELVKTIAKEGAQMKQVQKPVQFGVVPFAASVNVGPDNATATWMDTDGRSPIHHENFDWSTMAAFDAEKRVEQSNGIYYKRGENWGAEAGQKVTRFTLYDDIKRVTSTSTDWAYECTRFYSDGSCRRYGWVEKTTRTHGSFASWGGCVEMRPYPLNINDAPADRTRPETLFVPMFAPDETDKTDGNRRPANNNWWDDFTSGSTSAAYDQAYMPKYYDDTYETRAMGMDEGPNASCSTKPITALTDVGSTTGLNKIYTAIDAMEANGATNVTEGLAWGWRVVSGRAPFSEGRPDNETGNDKVVIVLTDGANTYYTPGSVSAQDYSGSYYRYGGNDLAGSRSIYSNYGYVRNRAGNSRLFDGATGASSYDYSNGNYSKAMTSHMSAICENAKSDKIMVMTVALDLDATDANEKKQIDALKTCSSESRTRKDGNGKPVKLFWNATSGDLDDAFKAIGDELSNLRIVG
ncbi:TadE/TadG family type IV pilus assembly protein [Nitratireductor sp.]|uniref:TadE/TadG family type IV pilus assembly protein n=1 Tax=Nitratireductor sp. TaxID=1872084 RepID=UPI00262EC7E0|nr:TadE/TadG family type IV pilus assembly protein [Nitratireductor sp.]MCV0379495.1 pilus assembly protein [Nitratireductor sp.]